MFLSDANLTEIISKYRVPEHPDLGFTYHVPLQPGDTVWVALKKECSEFNPANTVDINLESRGVWKRGTVLSRGNLRPLPLVPPMACDNGEPMLEMVYLCEWKHGKNRERGEKSAVGEVLPDTPFIRLLLLESAILLGEDMRYASTELDMMSTEDVINQSRLYSKDTELPLEDDWRQELDRRFKRNMQKVRPLELAATCSAMATNAKFPPFSGRSRA